MASTREGPAKWKSHVMQTKEDFTYHQHFLLRPALCAVGVVCWFSAAG